MSLTTDSRCVQQNSCTKSQLQSSGYYKCLEDAITIRGSSLDPRGFQSSKQDLILVLKNLDQRVKYQISWSIGSLYDGSSLDTTHVFHNFDVPSQLREIPYQQAQHIIGSLKGVLSKQIGTQLSIPFYDLTTRLIYQFIATVDTNIISIYVPVNNIPQLRPLEQVLSDIDFFVTPRSGSAMTTTFNVYYNALQKQSIMQDCGIDGALYDITVAEANSQDQVQQELQNWHITRSSPASQLAFDFVVPYVASSTFVGISLTVSCGDYQFIGFRKILVRAASLDVTKSTAF
jgi:hypothetical protein